MYKANQEALFQQTNQQLISIRQAEIQYYTNVNVAIGTQAALIGGFTYGIFTQNQPNPDYHYSKRFMTGYYVASAVTIASAVHVIINTMLLQVMAPGLALNGPVGSMARAADGMRKEQGQVTYAFGIMMFFFSIATTLSFWAVMDVEAAIVNTIIFGIAARMWYYFGRRVYYRLYWNDQDAFNDDQRESDVDPSDMIQMNPMIANGNGSTNLVNTTDDTNKPEQKSGGRKNSMRMISGIFSKRSSNNADDGKESNSEKTSSATSGDLSPTGNKMNTKNVICEGYFLKRGVLSGEKAGASKWERRYFVLLQNGYLFYYKTRQEYREDPKNSLKERPLELAEFKVVVIQNAKNPLDDDQMSVYSSEGTKSLAKNSEIKMVFQIDLLPIDHLSRRWSLRCDTEEELEMWVEALKEACPQCFENLETVAND
jgi:hypothetical protein